MNSYYDKDLIEVGLDEAGRGSLAGAVFAAAVILPKNFYHKLLNDSKLVNLKNRLLLRDYIIKQADEFKIFSISENEIDKINILQASIKAMHCCLDNFKIIPNLILVDGNYFKPYKNIEYQCIIKGDSKFAPIAAASILAKTFRDDYMKQIDLEFPQYDWKNNKGYGTKNHINALKEYGQCKYHRKSFSYK